MVGREVVFEVEKVRPEFRHLSAN